MIQSAPVAGRTALKGLNHAAWRCIDAEQTRAFYEDLLGLPLVHVVTSDSVPSTGESGAFCHLFFEFADGSCIAFFDVGDSRGATLSDDMPGWLTHFAMEVDSMETLLAMRARLEAAGIEVLGVTDHHFLASIYFFDPNGLRLEITVPTGTPEYMRAAKSEAHDRVAEWSAAKARRTLV